MKMYVRLIISILLMIVLGACNNGGYKSDKEVSSQVLQEISSTLERQSYRFDGSTSLRGDNFNHENIVNLTGYVDKNRNTYLNLKTPQEENGLVEDMDLYAKGDQVFRRYADQVDWEPVGDRTPLVEMEMNHWSPQAHFQRMQSMASRIEHLGRRSNIETIRVILDRDALKNDFLSNIEARIFENSSLDKSDMFKSLSTGQAGEQGVMEEIEGLHNTLKQDFDELHRSIGISGEYIIHYDVSRKVPTQITYTQMTGYAQDGRNETEISKTDIKLTRFGEGQIPTDIP